MTRRLLFGLLAVVASAAAVLSFAALDELGQLCGFGTLSALLPVVIDAGAAAGSVAWLSQPPGAARGFGRTLALVLLAGSVAGNALSHGLSAYALTASWWVVVAVSAVPPAVLGAVVHLATLTAHGHTGGHEQVGGATGKGAGTGDTPGWEAAPTPDGSSGIPVPAPGSSLVQVGQGVGADNLAVDRAAELIAEGVGRRRLARELDITEYQARQLMDGHTNGNGSTS